jgi:hypothetical protein
MGRFRLDFAGAEREFDAAEQGWAGVGLGTTVATSFDSAGVADKVRDFGYPEH